jgi:hypothetical protein
VLARRPALARQPKRGGILRVRALVLDMQRCAAEQQYYYANNVGFTASWPPYVKSYAPSPSFDYGNRAATLWLDR